MKTDIQIASKYINLIQSARDRNIEFNLSLKGLIKLYSTKRCYYTNIKLTSSNFSIDRIDNDKGYIDGNVVACEEQFNKRKANITVSEIKLLYKGIMKHEQQNSKTKR